VNDRPPVDERDRQGWTMSENGARASGTPFISFFRPDEFVGLEVDHDNGSPRDAVPQRRWAPWAWER